MTDFEAIIQYSFHDKNLLETALTHSSYANEHREQGHNERLEFLGDAVLELISSAYLYRSFPGEPEGVLSRRRAQLVCEASLAVCARRLAMGPLLKLGKGEDKSGGREKDSLLADALEAVIGAIYLDGGLAFAVSFVERELLMPMINESVVFDAKTRLQEWLQQDGEIEILYKNLEESDETGHKSFYAEVYAAGQRLGCGRGHNKKQAEQMAAADALSRLH